MIDIRKGYLPLHSTRSAINSSAGIESAALVANEINTPAYLENAFFGAHPDILDRKNLPSGSRVSVLNPTGPYSDESVMVVAAGPESLKRVPIITETIYDLPEDAQHAYWNATVTCMRVMCDQDRQDCHHIFGMENCVNSRTSSEQRTSRSVGLPHIHILRLDENSIEDQEWQMDHLAKEQRFFRFKAMMRPLLAQVSQEFARKIGFDLNPELRDKAPFGYSFKVAKLGDVTQTTQVMEAHHQAYTKVAVQTLAKLASTNHARLIPPISQPSYRLYLEIKDGTLEAAISPEIFSHAGVMEAAGIKLDRNAEHPVRKSPADLDRLHQEIKQQLS